MPRTKVQKKNGPAKRPRDQVNEEALSAARREVEKKVEAFQHESDFISQQVVNKINSAIQNIRNQLSPGFLNMKLYDLFHGKTEENNATACAADLTVASSITASYLNGTSTRKHCDEGYLTESSQSSILSTVQRSRPLGPLASAKARTRRSRSAQKPTTTTLHQSRQTHRTPAGKRLQTMSAERGMQPITPKMQPNMPVSMLRYQRMGETVISMAGSPVIAQGIPGDAANINIPVANGVISVLPSVMSSIEPSFISQLKPETLKQLKMLQTNLNMMMNQVQDSAL